MTPLVSGFWGSPHKGVRENLAPGILLRDDEANDKGGIKYEPVHSLSPGDDYQVFASRLSAQVKTMVLHFDC